MNTFFTADHHFGHENIIKYCNRPFQDVRQMDEEMISRWNEVVGRSDLVYHVGDFTLGDSMQARRYFRRLNGLIRVLPGSHDRWMERYDSKPKPISASDAFVQILPPLVTVMPDEYPMHITLCHYAMRSWDRSHYGKWHLFGHHHGNMEPYGLSFDCGVDTNNFYPYSLKQVVEKMLTLEPVVDYSKS